MKLIIFGLDKSKQVINLTSHFLYNERNGKPVKLTEGELQTKARTSAESILGANFYGYFLDLS